MRWRCAVNPRRDMGGAHTSSLIQLTKALEHSRASMRREAFALHHGRSGSLSRRFVRVESCAQSEEGWMVG